MRTETDDAVLMAADMMYDAIRSLLDSASIANFREAISELEKAHEEYDAATEAEATR